MKNLRWLAALVLVLAACGDDADSGDAHADTGSDATTEPGDTEPADTDQGGDSSPGDTGEGDADGDVDGDTGEDDAGPEPCEASDEPKCSDDGYDILSCVDGFWSATPCMQDRGLLCEDAKCVAPWSWGAPEWSSCPDEPLATAESLAEKAAGYEEIARRLHVHPDLGWMMSVTLKTHQVPCDGEEGSGDDEPELCTVPVVGADEATFDDVARWHTGENDGLWSSLYLAAEAFRYGATGDEEALEMIRLMLDSEVVRMEITGVPGVFTRQFIPPGVPGISCPTDPAEYRVDVEKDDNQWVEIRDDGCVWVVSNVSDEWTQTEHCGFEEFAGYCWLDNVSQDEYAGHMFALGALWKFVDVPDVREKTASLIEQVGAHLVENDLTFVDWDGRITEHGRLYAWSFAGFPGFLAAEALGFIRMAAVVSERDDIQRFYDECLLQSTGQGKCMRWASERGLPYHIAALPDLGLFLGHDGCQSNYNNHSMVMAYLWVLLEFETDPELREHIQGIVDERVFNADSHRAIGNQGNAWFNIMWAAMKQLGPTSDGPAFAAVEEANCAMRQFPASKVTSARHPEDEFEHSCEGRLGDSQSHEVIPVAMRCPETFLWWRSPYDRRGCEENLSLVRMPADYLLTYWMARYYGFLGADD